MVRVQLKCIECGYKGPFTNFAAQCFEVVPIGDNRTPKFLGDICKTCWLIKKVKESNAAAI